MVRLSDAFIASVTPSRPFALLTGVASDRIGVGPLYAVCVRKTKGRNRCPERVGLSNRRWQGAASSARTCGACRGWSGRSRFADDQGRAPDRRGGRDFCGQAGRQGHSGAGERWCADRAGRQEQGRAFRFRRTRSSGGLLEAALQGGERRGVRLKGGDPFVFGRGGEEVEEALRAAGIEVEVLVAGDFIGAGACGIGADFR